MRLSMGPFKAYMKKNKINHYFVADSTELSKSTIDKFMQKKFTIDTLLKVCETYKLQLSDVVELCHDIPEDNAVDCEINLPDKLQAIFLMCEGKLDKYQKEHKETPSVAEIYRDAFLDCLDLCYEYLK